MYGLEGYPQALCSNAKARHWRLNTDPGYRTKLMTYSAFSLVCNTLTGHRNWTRAWQDPEQKKRYDVVIIGGARPALRRSAD
jgi:hypothetical protein